MTCDNATRVKTLAFIVSLNYKVNIIFDIGISFDLRNVTSDDRIDIVMFEGFFGIWDQNLGSMPERVKK